MRHYFKLALLVGLSIIASTVTSCGSSSTSTEPPEVETARATMSSNCAYRNVTPVIKPNPKGTGKVVMFGPARYLVKGSTVYAINGIASSCSAGISYTDEVSTSDVE
jgi:hypothetical protein